MAHNLPAEIADLYDKADKALIKYLADEGYNDHDTALNMALMNNMRVTDLLDSVFADDEEEEA